MQAFRNDEHLEDTEGVVMRRFPPGEIAIVDETLVMMIIVAWVWEDVTWKVLVIIENQLRTLGWVGLRSCWTFDEWQSHVAATFFT